MRLFIILLCPTFEQVINIKNKELVVAVGNRIREFRKERNFSQEDLANEAEIPLSQIGRIERGETNPTISSLHVISIALGIELKQLVDIKI
ncbi:helix-turn-helix domain-containing protein [Sediminibacterium sp.]|uniref:helix-turn-helix domain-containing protein n=1 Tax=Sediminibacterium sp. TaxID=1917865 RepID=UPI00272F2C85|nr:helix-turn-helix transcriptional regulator [Sediminibacterium sp.]MDP2420093.1 helix-turn-helix transcriptional regulator [Sediminibacterium sp.]